MTPDAESPEDMRDRLRVLEKENEALAERAEDISLLGLVAEQVGIEADPQELLTAVLERVCILKAIPFGVCLEVTRTSLMPVAVYDLRHAEASREDLFWLRDPAAWPLPSARVLDAAGCEQLFKKLLIQGFEEGAPAVVLVPLRCANGMNGCLLFADDTRLPGELAARLPLLERVADLVQARLDNLGLIARLQRLNLDLDHEVAARTVALRRSEERYRILFDHVPDGVLMVSADEEGHFGRIEDANEQAARMHGYTLAELKQLDVEALSSAVPGPRLESFEARVWRLQPGQTVQEELTHRRKDGTTFPVEAIGTLVRIHGRQYILAFSRDITDRKQAEQALLRTQRVESIGVLAGGIAHDFNNLLTAILGQTGIAMELVGPDSEAGDHLEKALRASEKAATLTQQMLAYSGRGKFTIRPVYLNEVIQENLGILEAAMPKQVRFQLHLDPDLPAVTGDPSQLQQVIMNLVINAAEAIGDQPGVITLRTRALHLEAVDPLAWPLSGNSLGAGDYVWLEVADTGCGMAPEVRTRVFDPFFSTKSKGHGLGLSAVQGIIRAHRGGLGVDSLEGQGTTFRILLPAGSPDHPGASSLTGRGLGAEAKVVLVIDDEDYMLEVVADTLDMEGHRALLAASGEEGLELLRQQGQRIDLVLLDLTMPGWGGVETFRRLRALDAELPVVLCSGFAQEEAMAQVRGLDLAGFLQKPFLIGDLLRLVGTTSRSNARR